MNVSDILKSRSFQLGSVGVVAFAGGAGLGYILGRRRPIVEEVEIIEQLEFDYTEEDVELVRNEPEGVISLEEIAPRIEIPEVEEVSSEDEEEEVIEEEETEVEEEVEEDEDEVDIDDEEPAMEDDDKYIEEAEPEEDDEDDDYEFNLANVFASAPPPNWDHEDEVARRTPDKPYILAQYEFINDERGYRQTTLTYYDKDDIMTDEADTPLYNYGKTVGELKFGHGSNDKHVFYVRNESLKAEYEILMFKGYYAEEILGLEANEQIEKELKHSNLKFREDD